METSVSICSIGPYTRYIKIVSPKFTPCKTSINRTPTPLEKGIVPLPLKYTNIIHINETNHFGKKSAMLPIFCYKPTPSGIIQWKNRVNTWSLETVGQQNKTKNQNTCIHKPKALPSNSSKYHQGMVIISSNFIGRGKKTQTSCMNFLSNKNSAII